MSSVERAVGARGRFRLARVAAPLALVVALACNSDQLQSVSGELQIRDAVDFGAVALGRRSVHRLELENVGRAPLRIDTLDFDAPALKDFTASAELPVVLASGEKTSIALSFAPTALGARGVRLRVPTDSTRTPDAAVDLLGEGVLAKADVGPASLDFGQVAVKTTRTLALTLTNTLPNTAEVEVQAPSGADGSSFTAVPTGTVLVPANATKQVPIVFAPMRLGAHVGALVVRPCPSCQTQTIALTGEGIAATLVADPDKLEFGYTPAHQLATLKTTITNEGSATVELTKVELAPGSSTDFSLPAPLAATPLAHGQSVDVEVGFTPSDLDAKSGAVRVEYRDPSWTSAQVLQVPVTGSGGGPSIEVVPNPLAFPRTGVGMQVDKHVVVRNLGKDPTHPLVVTNLTITPAGEFTLVPPNDQGPLTIVPGKQVYLTVRYAAAMEGQSTATLEIDSNDPNTPRLLVPITASASKLGPCSYEVRPAKLDFGAVAVGHTAELGFRLTNVGQDTCAVANVKLSPTTPPEFAMDEISTRLVDPGQSLYVPVDFAPDQPQAYAGEVDFDVSDPQHPTGAVPLNGSGIAPCLTVTPDHLDFGDVGLACQPPQQSVEVQNACNVPVTLTDVDVGAGTSDAFTIDQGGGAHTLQPGQDLTVTVTYAPTVEGDDSAPLELHTSLSPVPVDVPLYGHASLRPTQTDTFTIPFQNKVDFLFVVDNSGSMQDKQTAMAKNFDHFINAALGNGTDFHIAVTTTGLYPYRGGWADCPGGAYGGEDGRFFPVDGAEPRIITTTTPNMKAVFQNNVQVGICHWDEQGLEAMHRALTTPLIDHADDPATPEPNDGNGGFLRPDAKLYVLFVGDSDDGASGWADPNQYVQFLFSLKPGRPDLVTASGVVGLPSCPTIESVGTRFMQVINATGGIIADICSPDWSGIFDKIGKDAFTPRSTFPLTRAPDGRAVQVAIDGQDVPQTAADGSSNWHFDPSIGLYGAVVFDNDRGPGPNQTVEITYPVPCPPAS